jgi:hypothetical protein
VKGFRANTRKEGEMDRNGRDWMIIGLLCLLIMLVCIGFEEVFARLARPRVLYVHEGGKSGRDDAA